MKNVILTAVTLVFVGLVGNANAQSTADVTVNIKLKPIHTIIVNPAAKSAIDLSYQTKEDYMNGVSRTELDQLLIFSTGGFVVKVNAATDFQHTSGSTIDASSVKVQATKGGGNIVDLASNPEVALGTGLVDLIKSNNGGRDQKFNVTYTGKGEDLYINNYRKVDDANASVYTATVTYTILAD